jgi:hypothetical protein
LRTNCPQLAGVSAKFAEALASETGSKFNETAAATDFQNLANAAPAAIRPLQAAVAVFKEPNLKAAEAGLRGWSKKNCP